MTTKISETDMNSIVYFMDKYEDVERWVEWGKKEKLVREEYPILIDAIANFKVARQLLELNLYEFQQWWFENND